MRDGTEKFSGLDCQRDAHVTQMLYCVRTVTATDQPTTRATSSATTNSRCCTSETELDCDWSYSARTRRPTTAWPNGRGRSTGLASGSTYWPRTGPPTTATRTGSATRPPTSSLEHTPTA